MWKIVIHGILAFIISFATAMVATLTQAMQDNTEIHQYALYVALLGALGTAAKDWYALTQAPPEG